MRHPGPARLLLVTLLAVSGMARCAGGDEPPARNTAEPAPAAVTDVLPPEAFVGPSPAQVSVTLDLQRDGGVDLSTVRLRLDGRDVTDRSGRAGTDDVPQSRAGLSYRVEPALPAGEHQAEVEYRAGGEAHRYAWTFTVRG